jgi:hypothetical protein
MLGAPPHRLSTLVVDQATCHRPFIKSQILLGELANLGANLERTGLDKLGIGNPAIDWLNLAKSVEAEAARTHTPKASPNGWLTRLTIRTIPHRVADQIVPNHREEVMVGQASA